MCSQVVECEEGDYLDVAVLSWGACEVKMDTFGGVCDVLA